MFREDLKAFIAKAKDRGLEFFGLYYSEYPAVVQDNKDPDKRSRLHLAIPAITGYVTHPYWALPRTFSGKGYGSQVLPQIGDMVWVTFQNGNPNKPRWQHGQYGKDEKPSDNNKHDVNYYWFQTPAGHFIGIDDTNKTIKIRSAKGTEILIDDVTKAIYLFNEDGIYQEISDKIYLLSQLGSTKKEKAAKGETLKAKLDELADQIKALADATALLTVATAVGPSSIPLNVVSFTGISTQITTIKAQFKEIYSDNVELD